MKRGLFFLFFLTSFLWADGVMVIRIRPPHPIPRPLPRPIPLAVKYHHVKVSIQDQIAVTQVDQVFYNPNPWPVEGTYIFPLPLRATMKQFSMYMGGKEVQGELLDSEQAKQIYFSIVRRMKDPALLEYVGRGMFRARVFPIPARGEARIKLTYTELLPQEGNLVEYIYPLNTERFSSRPLKEVVLRVEIKSQRPIRMVYSPSHKVDVVRKGEKHVLVGFERRNVRPDRDFKLYFSRTQKNIAVDLISTVLPTEDRGYFLLVVTPPSNLDPSQMVPKDIVFVLDTSGSMAGERLAQAKKALKFCIQSLQSFDRFAIVDFSTEARVFREGLVSASQEAKQRALAYVDALVARGGTNIYDALSKAFQMAKGEGERPFMICFLTDGEPTVGNIVEPEGILKKVKEWNQRRVRIFVLGVGTNLNAKFLDKLAQENFGSRTYIGEQENIEVKVSQFFTKIAYPALSDVSLRFQGEIQVQEVYPRHLPDLFAGTQLRVFGRYTGEGSGAVILEGMRRGQKVREVYEVRFVSQGGPEEVATLWANQKIAYLLEQIRLHGEKEELKREVVRLAKKFGIVTPYTSYLVVEDVRRRPHRSPRAWEKARAFRIGSPAAKEAREMLRKVSGKKAVKGSVILLKQKEAKSLEEVENRGRKKLIRQVGGKTFYLGNGIWVDSDYEEKDGLVKVELKQFSDEYFALLKKHPEVGKYLSLGKVIFVFQGKVYVVK